ncbi:hypothetical protein CLPUN_39200 [Clostridium puniceum]|uniref:Uncharacterized protein n=1 Tax=Clostridium puniceum TaxID=29367 RepID=A0A1S8T9L4_9CLOT|nr:hypothetical protein [Clostridium puniceum]OOM74467.1 hypothetical protein CLPUN_39200 [Clostridium puniceum]
MGKYCEKFFPLGLSIIFLVIICFVNINSIVNMKDIILSIITFASILIGFLTTMLSILITAIDSSIMKYLKRNKRIKDLYWYLSIPILMGFILIIICLMFIPISDASNYKIYPNYYFLGFFLSYFVLLCIRSIGILLLLLFEFIDEGNEEGDNKEDDLDLSNAFKENKNQ